MPEPDLYKKRSLARTNTSPVTFRQMACASAAGVADVIPCDGAVQAGKAPPFVLRGKPICVFSMEMNSSDDPMAPAALIIQRPAGPGKFSKNEERRLKTLCISEKICASLVKNGHTVLQLTPGHRYTSMQIDPITGMVFFTFATSEGAFGAELLNMRTQKMAIMKAAGPEFFGAALKDGHVFVLGRTAVNIYDLHNLGAMPSLVNIEFGSELTTRWTFCEVMDRENCTLLLMQPAAVSGKDTSPKESKATVRNLTDGLALYLVGGRLRASYIVSSVPPTCTSSTFAAFRNGIVCVCSFQDLVAESMTDPFDFASSLLTSASAAEISGSVSIQTAALGDFRAVRFTVPPGDGQVVAFWILGIALTVSTLYVVAGIMFKPDADSEPIQATDCVAIDLLSAKPNSRVSGKRLQGVVPSEVMRVYLSDNDLIVRVRDSTGQQLIRCFNSKMI